MDITTSTDVRVPIRHPENRRGEVPFRKYPSPPGGAGTPKMTERRAIEGQQGRNFMTVETVKARATPARAPMSAIGCG